MTNNASANNSFAASVIARYETNFQKYISAYTDWAAFACQMETNNGQSKVVARMEYPSQNEVSGAWTQAYGNTTDTQFIPDRNAELDRATRFCSRLNTMYWQTIKDEYLNKNPNVDPEAPEFNEQEAMADLELMNILTSLEEAQLNHAKNLAKLHWLRTHYEDVTGAEFKYVPYIEKPRAATSIKANAKLGAALLKRAAA